MFSDKIKHIDSILNANHKVFNSISDRNFWDSVSPKLREKMLTEADKHLKIEHKLLTASSYMEYFNDGNRSNYQENYFLRRESLHYLVIAECILDNNKYMSAIVDLIWMILEETTWVIPAHNVSFGYGNDDLNQPLYNRDIDMLDLFSCETGATISITCHLLKKKLDEISPLIYDRAQDEVEKRILVPYINRTDFSFMGFVQGPHTKTNNWNPWINSNCLYCLVLSSLSNSKKIYGIKKILNSLNIYISNYSDDGGCDEGPTYYSHSVCSLLVLLELIYEMTDRRFNIFNTAKIRKMVEYILKSHISQDLYTNFADSRLHTFIPPALLYRYGKYIDDENIMAFGSYLLKLDNVNMNYNAGFHKLLRLIASYDEVMNHNDNYVETNKAYFDKLQIFNIRNSSLFLSVKGGNNNENHNHNDVGNFIIYYENNPLIIDNGNATYTRETFGSGRYDIWTNKSEYHNLPIINGFGQSNGVKYRAENVIQTGNKISMDISKAYDEKADLKSCYREIEFNTSNMEIQLHDIIIPKDTLNTYTMVLMSNFFPQINENLITVDYSGHRLSIEYDSAIFTCETDIIGISDQFLREGFDDKIHRILFNMRVPHDNLDYVIKFKNVNINEQAVR